MSKPNERLRGRKLQNLRRIVLGVNPLCVACQAKGKVSLATDMDHIKPLHKGGTDDLDNLQGLCSDCHKVKTADDMGLSQRSQFDERGRVKW